MGVVWSAVNVHTSRQVAVKLISSARDDLQERLIREARACGQLSHRNIIEVLDAGVTEQGEPFLVMPLLVGETLADLVERRRRLEHSTVAQIGREIARGLKAAHAAGIVHRDLKPSNIFLHQEPFAEGAVVKVVDFGICKKLNGDEAKLTTTGKVVGSPYYMSPEQFNTRLPIDPRTDIWSLGVILFELLTGVRPFQGDRVKLILSILDEREEIPLVSQLVRGVPPGLVDIVSRCLQRDREKRIGTAAELVELLRPFGSPGDYVRIYSDGPKREMLPSDREIEQTRSGAVPIETSSAAVAPAEASTLEACVPNAATATTEPLPHIGRDYEKNITPPGQRRGVERPPELGIMLLVMVAGLALTVFCGALALFAVRYVTREHSMMLINGLPSLSLVAAAAAVPELEKAQHLNPTQADPPPPESDFSVAPKMVDGRLTHGGSGGIQ